MFALRLGLQFDDLGDDRDVCDRSEFGSRLPWVSYIESLTFGTRIDLFSVLSVVVIEVGIGLVVVAEAEAEEAEEVVV